MRKTLIVLSAFFIIIASVSCSKKTNPTTTAAKTDTVAVKTLKTVKPVKKPTLKTAVPKVITVNDKVAKRSVDGRYYYDLEGRRYWRNNRDGKYYLFNKSMFDDPDFKSSGN
jgi:hypothetical protein